jgi:outer membrane protein TolC
MTFFRKAALEQRRHARLVFSQKKLHESMLANCAALCFQRFFSRNSENGGLRRTRILAFRICFVICIAALAFGQAAAPRPGIASPVITLDDALARARQYGGQVQTANLAVLSAHEDRAQARAARLPQISGLNQFIYTQGNGTPSGVFVANDGVHVYNEQLNGHEELLALLRRGEVRRAMAAEAVARARVEIAARGLNAIVIQDYFAIAVAKHKLINARTSLAESERFLDIARKQEQAGEAAHADVVKAQIDTQQRQRDLTEAQLALEKAKIALGVLIFPDFSSNFDVVDDMSAQVLLPPLPEAEAQAKATSPDLQAAKSSVEQATYDVTIARYGYLPSFGLDVWYGINANEFAARSDEAQATGRSTLPNYQVENRQNLGYAAQATLNIPLWNWGSIRSKVKQAQFRRQQAEIDLSVTQKTLSGNLAAYYAEAQVAQNQIASLRSSADLAQESLRLTVLRYQAGEATALEVVDAQNTLNLARNAYEDGLLRFRVALGNLQTLTGRL